MEKTARLLCRLVGTDPDVPDPVTEEPAWRLWETEANELDNALKGGNNDLKQLRRMLVRYTDRPDELLEEMIDAGYLRRSAYKVGCVECGRIDKKYRKGLCERCYAALRRRTRDVL